MGRLRLRTMRGNPRWRTHFWEVRQDHDFLCSCWASIINGPQRTSANPVFNPSYTRDSHCQPPSKRRATQPLPISPFSEDTRDPPHLWEGSGPKFSQPSSTTLSSVTLHKPLHPSVLRFPPLDPANSASPQGLLHSDASKAMDTLCAHGNSVTGCPLLLPLLWQPSPAPPCPGWLPLSVPTPPALAWQTAGPGAKPWLTQGWPHGGQRTSVRGSQVWEWVGTSLRPLVLSRLSLAGSLEREVPAPSCPSVPRGVSEVRAESLHDADIHLVRMVQEAFRGRATQGS